MEHGSINKVLLYTSYIFKSAIYIIHSDSLDYFTTPLNCTIKYKRENWRSETQLS